MKTPLIILAFFAVACGGSPQNRGIVVHNAAPVSPTVEAVRVSTQTPTPMPEKSKPTIPKDILAFVESIKNLEQKGRDMESLRGSGMTKTIKCTEEMRANRTLAEDLETKSEKLPQLYKTFLAPATVELKMCVVCSSNATDSCDRANQLIQDMYKRLEEN